MAFEGDDRRSESTMVPSIEPVISYIRRLPAKTNYPSIHDSAKLSTAEPGTIPIREKATGYTND